MREMLSDKKSGRIWVGPAVIGGAVLAFSLLHYFTNLHYHFLHAVYQRLYYIPIIYAAFVYGSRGGIITAAAATAAYLPHIFMQWGMGHHFGDQISDVVMFNVMGTLTGLMSDRRRRLEAQQRDAYERLEDSFEKAKESARLAAVGQLSAAVAHEIRNPLNGIRGALDIVLERFTPEDKEYRFAEIARRETRRLEEIVTEFLDFARPKEPQIMRANLANIIDAVADICRSHAEARGVSLSVGTPEGALFADVDADQMRQVMLNLALNGIEACAEGGRVEIGAKQRNGGAVMYVRDTGSGMSEEEIKGIFEPFFTTKPSGTGLGLAVSRRIVEKHAGEIRVSSKAGMGSEFEVFLAGE